jgi:general secretion pathway protein J
MTVISTSVAPAKAGAHAMVGTRRSHGFQLSLERRVGKRSADRSAEHGFTPAWRSAEHGFTLVELMVSLLIFGILAAGGVMLLSFSVSAQASAKTRLDEIAEIRRLGSALTGDLAQAVPRTTRDGLGDRAPAFRGAAGNGAGPLMTFVRAGWSNSAGASRASLQKVEYRLDGDRLERVAYPMLDGGEPQAGAVVLEGVRSIQMRYRKDGEWLDAWAESQPELLPSAVEMVIDRGDGAPIRQVFVAGSGYRQ